MLRKACLNHSTSSHDPSSSPETKNNKSFIVIKTSLINDIIKNELYSIKHFIFQTRLTKWITAK